MATIVFTSDVDWAPEEVIADTVELFERYNVKCTFFATHASPVLRALDRKKFEIGIHPNFNELLNGKRPNTKFVDVIEEYHNLYPEAVGVRSHSMTQNSPILDAFLQAGFTYDSNHFLPYHQIQPFELWNGLVRVPYNWEDDVQWAYGKDFSSLSFDPLNGLVIADFHPIHIFLNTERQERYNQAKQYYQQPKELIRFRNNETPGTRTLLINLLEKQSKSNSFFMRDMASGSYLPVIKP